MKIEWEGRAYDYDALSVLLSQSDQILKYTGCRTLSEWETLLLKPDDERFPKSITAACWLMLAQDGQDVKLGELDIPYLKFLQAFADGIAAEQAAAALAAEADPTSAAAGSGETSPETPIPVSGG